MHDLTRRDFARLATAATATAAAGLAPVAAAAARHQPAPAGATGADAAAPRPLKLLILGGTGFLGPAIVQAALDRGHTITLFNRGRSAPGMFADLERLVGNRDPEIDAGLSALEGRRFDGVLDTSGYVPRIVEASAKLLAPNTDHYVFVSSISVYDDPSQTGITESDAVGTIDDADTETVDGRTYGPLKALCEQAATAAMTAAGGRCTNVRPGFIVGPRDRSANRLPLWVRRVATRDRIVCPGDQGGQLQLIDARDIATFCIRCIERSQAGPYNLVGPAKPLTTRAYVDEVCRGVGRSPERVWVGEDALAEAGLAGSFVPWIPNGGDSAGFASVSHARALRDGLTFRSVADSARDTLAWLMSEDGAAVRGRVQSLLDSGAEDALLAGSAAPAAVPG